MFGLEEILIFHQILFDPKSEVYYQKNWFDINTLDQNIDINGDLQPLVDSYLSCYAATDEKHDPENCPFTEEDLIATRGIEVGHIFYFGTKYSEPMKAFVVNPDGKKVPVHMGSHGIGVSRLVGAIIEASHDEKGIIWPEPVAPFFCRPYKFKLQRRGVCTSL